MDEDERVSVLANAQDVHLLREIARWRRANGVTYFQWRPGVGFGAFTEWYRYVDKKRRTVSYEPSDATVLVDGDYYGAGCFVKLPVRTVAEAVDVLVALGFLPARFSSAYRAGWDARAEAEFNGHRTGDVDHYAEAYLPDKVPAVEPVF